MDNIQNDSRNGVRYDLTGDKDDLTTQTEFAAENHNIRCKNNNRVETLESYPEDNSDAVIDDTERLEKRIKMMDICDETLIDAASQITIETIAAAKECARLESTISISDRCCDDISTESLIQKSICDLEPDSPLEEQVASCSLGMQDTGQDPSLALLTNTDQSGDKTAMADGAGLDDQDANDDLVRYLKAEAEYFFYAGGDQLNERMGKTLPAIPEEHGEDNSDHEFNINSSVHDAESYECNSLGSDEAYGKQRIIIAAWAEAAEFIPKTQYKEEVCEMEDSMKTSNDSEKAMIYINNNNCYDRNKSFTFKPISVDYSLSEEVQDMHSGEENSQADVVDIIVLPDAQEKIIPQSHAVHSRTFRPGFPRPLFRPRAPVFAPSSYIPPRYPPNHQMPMPGGFNPRFNQARPVSPRFPAPPIYPTTIPTVPRSVPPHMPRMCGPPQRQLMQPYNSMQFSATPSQIPYQEIDGCWYFPPSYYPPEAPPPGIQYGYPQRGKKRKAVRLSSRFPTQAGKFHHHANFYVKSCAESLVTSYSS